MPSQHPAAGNRIGELRYDLRLDCIQRARGKLDAAAQHFVQANYDAVLSLLRSGKAGAAGGCSCCLPFCITACRSAGTRMLRVSTACELQSHGAGGPADADEESTGREAGPRSLRACVEGEIRLDESTNCHSVCQRGVSSSEPGTAVVIDTLLPAGDVPAMEEFPRALLEMPLTHASWQKLPAAQPLVSDFYDTEEHGRLFRERYSGLRGEYFIFYSHGESQ